MYTAVIIAFTSHMRFKLTEVRAVLVSESRLWLSVYYYYAVFCSGVGIIITCNFSACYYVDFAFVVGAGKAATFLTHDIPHGLGHSKSVFFRKVRP